MELDTSDLGRSLKATLVGVATLVAPTTAVTALLYYFGWVRTSIQARELGLDDSLFGFSTQDYVLRSISSMYWPLFIGALATLVGLLLHGTIVSWTNGAAESPTSSGLERRHRRFLCLLIVVLVAAGGVSLMLGMMGSFVRQPSRFVSLASPLGVTVGIVLVSYAAYVFRRFLGRPPAENVAVELKYFRLLGSSLVIVLLLLGLFWTVSHYAGVKGVDLAIEVERRLPSQPSVVVYSPKRLHLQPPVQETELPQENSAYRYAYTGLKLLFRSDHKYFLRPSDSTDSRNIIITESQDLRLEFMRGD